MDVDHLVRWILTIGLSLCLLVISLCRLDALDRYSRIDYRLSYYVLALGALAVLLMWFHDPQPAGWPSLGIMTGTLGLLLADGALWKGGPPPESRR